MFVAVGVNGRSVTLQMKSTADSGLKYKAFLSYSHSDTKLLKRLHRALEKVTFDAANLRPIFLDHEVMAAGGQLPEAIRRALDASGALVVACSPAAVASPWVGEEVRYFRSRYPDRPVVPVIVGGPPGYSGAEAVGFPPALRFDVDGDGVITGRRSELVAADLREREGGWNVALVQITAGVTGLGAAEVSDRFARQQRRRLMGWIAGLSCLAVLLTVSLAYAVYNKQVAERNLDVAKALVDEMVFNVTNAVRGAKGGKIEEVERITESAQYAIGELQSVPLEQWIRELFNGGSGRGRPAAKTQKIDSARTKAGLILQQGVTAGAHGAVATQKRLSLEAVVILRGLAEANPSDIELIRELSVALNKVGEAQLRMNEIDGAAGVFKESLAIVETLLRRYPDSAFVKRDVSVPLIWLGDVALGGGKLDVAEDHYRRALSLLDEARAADLAKLGLSEADARKAGIDKNALDRDRSVALNKLGDVAAARPDLRRALGYYEQSLEIRQRLATANPNDVVMFRQVYVSQGNVGMMRFELGDFDGAVGIFRESVAGARKLNQLDPMS